MTLEVSGFFFCDVDRNTFYAQKASMQRGQIQHWIVAVTASEPVSDQQIASNVKQFLVESRNRTGLRVLAPDSNVSEVKLEGWTVGAPNLTDALQRVNAIKLPSNLVYARVSFRYDGLATEVPWPWISRGFQIQCPEDVLSGLVAVLPATIPPAIPEPSTSSFFPESPLKSFADDFWKVAKGALVLGGLGFVGYYFATKPRSRPRTRSYERY